MKKIKVPFNMTLFNTKGKLKMFISIGDGKESLVLFSKNTLSFTVLWNLKS